MFLLAVYGPALSANTDQGKIRITAHIPERIETLATTPAKEPFQHSDSRTKKTDNPLDEAQKPSLCLRSKQAINWRTFVTGAALSTKTPIIKPDTRQPGRSSRNGWCPRFLLSQLDSQAASGAVAVYFIVE